MLELLSAEGSRSASCWSRCAPSTSSPARSTPRSATSTARGTNTWSRTAHGPPTDRSGAAGNIAKSTQPRLPTRWEQRALLRVAATALLFEGSLVPRRAHWPASRTTVGTAPVAPRSSECRNPRRSSGRRGGLGGGRRRCRSCENRRAGRPYHQTNASTGAALPPLLRISFPGHPNRLRACRPALVQPRRRRSISSLLCRRPRFHPRAATRPYGSRSRKGPVPPLGGENSVRSTTTRQPGRELSQIAVVGYLRLYVV